MTFVPQAKSKEQNPEVLDSSNMELWLRQNPITSLLIWRNISHTLGYVLINLARLLDQASAGNKTQQSADVPDNLKRVVSASCALYRTTALRLSKRGIGLLVGLYSSEETIAYHIDPSRKSRAAELEKIAETGLKKEGVHYVNLSRAFAKVSGLNPSDFCYRYDRHWNRRAHRYGGLVLARALAGMIQLNESRE